MAEVNKGGDANSMMAAIASGAADASAVPQEEIKPGTQEAQLSDAPNNKISSAGNSAEEAVAALSQQKSLNSRVMQMAESMPGSSSGGQDPEAQGMIDMVATMRQNLDKHLLQFELRADEVNPKLEHLDHYLLPAVLELRDKLDQHVDLRPVVFETHQRLQDMRTVLYEHEKKLESKSLQTDQHTMDLQQLAESRNAIAKLLQKHRDRIEEHVKGQSERMKEVQQFCEEQEQRFSELKRELGAIRRAGDTSSKFSASASKGGAESSGNGTANANNSAELDAMKDTYEMVMGNQGKAILHHDVMNKALVDSVQDLNDVVEEHGRELDEVEKFCEDAYDVFF